MSIPPMTSLNTIHAPVVIARAQSMLAGEVWYSLFVVSPAAMACCIVKVISVTRAGKPRSP